MKRAEAQVKPEKRDSLRYVFRLLKRFLVGQHRVFVLAFLMLLMETVTAIFEPYPLAYLIDFLKGDSHTPNIFTRLGVPPAAVPASPVIATVAVLTMAMVLLAMVNSLADSLAEIYLAKGGRALGYNLRLTLYTHLQRLSLAFHGKQRTGDILTRITGDVSEIENFVISSLSDIAGSLLLLGGTMAFLLYQSWQVAVVALVIVPLLALVSNYFSQRIKVAVKAQRGREGDLASATQEMLSSIRVIQTYNGGDQALQRFAEYNQKAVAAALTAAGLQARFSWVVKLIEALATSAVVWAGVYLIYGSTTANFSVGMLILFIQLIENMFKPARKIIKEWNTIGKVFASVERIGEVLDRKPAVDDAPDAVTAPVLRGRIEFRAVDFAYQVDPEDAPDEAEVQEQGQARQVLNAVSFEVGAGEVFALVGHTGAGKSTVIQLLSRLYDPTGGRVLFDGVDIRRFTLDSLRSQISVVLQETVLFNGTVAENIAYGRSNASRDEIVQAAVQANAHEFITRMPQGYDTQLGERGANLSGGQRQRIAIARAFIRNTPILILDEPTTGLDAESSELVLLALRLLMRGKTTVIVSHDFKLVRQANKIAVLRQGRIEEMGTHRELLKQQGTYANLYIRQYGQNQPEEEPQGGSLYDLLHSPTFQQKWPAVRTAFDAEAMRVRLQAALFATGAEGADGPDGAGDADYAIVYCKPGKASYLNEGGCLLRYEVRIEHTATGETQASLLLARIFGSAGEAETYLATRLAPLVAKMAGRAEIAPFASPVALLEDLNMAVSVFPIDGELPMLIAATDPDRVLDLLHGAVPDEGPNHFEVEGCTVEPGHYGRQHRCVLRYRLHGSWVDQAGHDQTTSANRRQLVYGKVAADDRGKLVGMVVTALQRRLRHVHTSRRFRMPRILGYQPRLRLILLEAIPGEPKIAKQIEAFVAGKITGEGGTEALALAQAVADCAEIAVALHKVDVKLGEPRTLEHELVSLAAQMGPIEEFSLALAIQLQKALKVAGACAAQTRPWPLVFSHGDYTYTQLIFAEHSCGLVDFDTSCQAEPALDLGQYLAYVRLVARKAQGRLAPAAESGQALDPADDLCAWFLNTYMQAAGYRGMDAEQLCTRVAMYEIVSLVRIAQHSWLKLKGSRLELVTDLLEERVKCLTQRIATPAAQATPQHTQRRPALLRQAKAGQPHRHGSPQP